MTTHAEIDARIYRMLDACALKIDRDPALLAKVRENVSRIADERIKKDWAPLVALPWLELRQLLLERSQNGDQLRQNAPFGGILTKDERMSLFPSNVPKLDAEEVLRRTR